MRSRGPLVVRSPGTLDTQPLTVVNEQDSRTEHTLCNTMHTDLPLVDVVIVNSRGSDHKWFRQAYSSAREQTYGHLGVLVVYNNDHALSIGAARNLAARVSNAKWLLFLDDDDYISIDLVAHLASTIEKLRNRPVATSESSLSELVMISSGMTLVDGQDRVLSEQKQYDNGVLGHMYMQIHHTGMYLRDWLLKYPADETLSRYVSTDMQRKAIAYGKELGRRTTWATSYHYGYHYRQHIGMVSGEKLVRV